MRKGFTTGSCSAAAAKAATFMLLSKVKKETISIVTPAGVTYSTKVENIEISDDYVSCGIIKDSGDDPDITNGTLICAKVAIENELSRGEIVIEGGEGVGIVTRPGLEVKVGEAAINSVPRKMIEKEVREVIDFFEAEVGLRITIFVPDGKLLAKKTFNPHMGIESGISILGTSGIVEPMSVEALVKTIELDLKVKKAEGNKTVIMVPGNYGENFLVNNYAVDAKEIVHFSNYIGIAIDKAVEIGFENILIVGHTGKLVKVSGGIMNTHSKEADCRMELMLAAAIRAAGNCGRTIDNHLQLEILNQVTTTAVLDILKSIDLLDETCHELMKRIIYFMRKRAGESSNIECILYENNYGLLSASDNAEKLVMK